MQVGIVGFAGSGKSTLFELLTGARPDPGKIHSGQVGVAKAGGLEHLDSNEGRRVSVSKNPVVEFAHHDADYDNVPTPEELHGPTALRRVAAPIPWAVYTVAFVELCERFSYYGTQVVCRFLTLTPDSQLLTEQTPTL